MFHGCCGAAAPLASPGGKLSQNRLFGTDFVTDEECGQKCFVFYAATGFFLHFRYRRSSSVFFIALSGGDEKSTFPPGEGFAPCGQAALPEDACQFCKLSFSGVFMRPARFGRRGHFLPWFARCAIRQAREGPWGHFPGGRAYRFPDPFCRSCGRPGRQDGWPGNRRSPPR